MSDGKLQWEAKASPHQLGPTSLPFKAKACLCMLGAAVVLHSELTAQKPEADTIVKIWLE